MSKIIGVGEQLRVEMARRRVGAREFQNIAASIGIDIKENTVSIWCNEHKQPSARQIAKINRVLSEIDRRANTENSGENDSK